MVHDRLDVTPPLVLASRGLPARFQLGRKGARRQVPERRMRPLPVLVDPPIGDPLAGDPVEFLDPVGSLTEAHGPARPTFRQRENLLAGGGRGFAAFPDAVPML